MNTISINLTEDFEIIQQFSDGKTEIAASAFVRKYQNFVYSTALRYLQNYDDADDISQEVFIRAINNLNKFRGDSSIKTWLYRITSNHCISFLRKKKIRNYFKSMDNENFNNSEIRGNHPEPDKILENKEFMDKFNSCLLNLPEKQRETFALRYFEDLTYNEISKMLNVTVGGLKANYFHAIQKLSRMLNGTEDK